MAFEDFYRGKNSVRALATRTLSSLLQRRRLLFGAAIVLLLILFFGDYIKDAVVLLILGLIAVFSTIYKRFMRVPPAVELVTFSTVMVGLSYGPVAGAVFGAVATLAAEIFNSGVDAFIIGYIPARAVVGAVSSFFPAANIVYLGLSMSILYNLISQPLYALQSDAELRIKLLAFVIVNVSSNFIIFSLLGGLVKGVLL